MCAAWGVAGLRARGGGDAAGRRTRRGARRTGRTGAAIAVLLAVGLSVLAAAPASQARVPRVAAASSLNAVLPAIAEQFRRDRGERVELVFGASGALTRQIIDGAPFDLLLAADDEFPARLADARLTRDRGVVYAVGRLALFAPAGSPLRVDTGLDGLTRLIRAGKGGRFAIANPAVAPYGRAAEQVLRAHGLWEPLRTSLVLGDTVAQAAQFAASGNVAGGLIAYSLALTPALAARGSYVLIPASEHEPLRQRMVLMAGASPAAAHFYDYLQGAAARAAFTRFGFAVPD